jgi:nucleoside-diphosphate-sugar epimerase
LIVGATGEFGRHITKQCLQNPNLLVNVLVRNPEKHSELMEEVKNAGGNIIKADVTKPDTIVNSTKGIHTIVSALVGDNKTVIDGQILLLEDAVKNGVKRFVPTDYSLDIWKLSKGEHYFTDQRLIFRERLNKESSIKGLHLINGFFMETFMMINKDRFSYWGNKDTRLDLTSQEDAARYLASAIAKHDRIGDLKIVGDEITIEQARDIYNKATGRNLEVVREGSIEDLKNLINKEKEEGNFEDVSLNLGYALILWEGRAKIKDRMNQEFPDIKPLSFEQFVKKYGAKPSYDFFANRLPKNAKDEMKTYYCSSKKMETF